MPPFERKPNTRPTTQALRRSVRTVVLTGMATNLCVLYTANDAYMRDLQIVVPGDRVAANTAEDTAFALRQMRQSLKARVLPSADVDFERPKQRVLPPIPDEGPGRRARELPEDHCTGCSTLLA